MGRIRRAYTAREKLDVIKFAEARGNRAAGREYGVGESSVREWRKNKDRLQKLPRKKMAERGSSARYPELEKTLFEWVTEKRARGIGISTIEIRLQALVVARQLSVTDFRASVDWCYAFMRRSELSIRRRTHIAQKLPEDFEDKILDFQKFIIKQRKAQDFHLSQIGNADQTPLTFDLPYATTVNMKGARSVNINTTGHEKDRFTVMLACTADGGKLPPYVVFKRKTLPKGIKWPEGIIVRVQQKGWMNDDLMADWVKTVWGKRPGALTKKSLLVLDSFRCHKSEAIKNSLKHDHSTTLAIIPGGMTGILQPLDVGVNKPMKNILQRKWSTWFSSGVHSYTPAGRMRKPDLQDVVQWIVEAWAELDPAIIVRSFLKCSISNKMDGTEDDILWEEHCASRQQTADVEEVEEEDDSMQDDAIYLEENRSISDEDFRRLFDSDDDDEEFEGF